MREVFRTNNPVQISYIQALLSEAGIESVILDQHASVMKGSISAIEKRIMVLEEDLVEAENIIRESDV